MVSASDYLAQAQANSAPRIPAARKKSSGPAPQLTQITGGKLAKPQSPASWLIDILTRPLSGVTNAIQGGVNGIVDAQAASNKGDVGGAVVNSLKAANVPGNFLSGMFSNDPNQHRSFSQVLEQSTDKFGSLDPNYVNRQDNVNPIAKGIVGFVGDVALDPLTYIPGAQILKGIGLATKAAKVGIEAGGAASKAIMEVAKTAQAGKKAAEAAANAAVKVEVPTAATAAEAGAGRAVQNAVDTATADKAVLDSLPVPLTPEELLAQSQKSLDTALSGARATSMKKTLADLNPVGIKITPETAGIMAKINKDSRVAKSLPFEEWAVHAEDMVLDIPIAKQPKVFVGNKNIPMIEAIGKMQRGDQAARLGLNQWHTDNYFSAFNAGVKTGHKVDALGNAAKQADLAQAGAHAELQANFDAASTHFDQLSNDPAYAQSVLADALNSHAAASVNGGAREAVPTLDNLLKDAADETANAQLQLDAAMGKTTSASQVIYSARQQFLQQHETNLSGLTASLGPKVVTNLLRNSKSDGRFNDVIAEMTGILDRQIDPHQIEQLMPASTRMLNELGVTTPLPKGIQLAQELPNVSPVPLSMAEVAKRAAIDSTDPRVLAGAMPGMEKLLRDIQTAKSWVDETKTGVKMSPKAIKKRAGSRPNEFNQYKQMDISNPIMQHWSNLAKTAGKNGVALSGRDRANFVRDGFMQSLRLTERVIDENGIPLVLSIDSPRMPILPIAQSQILDILDEVNRRGMDAYYFNMSTSVPPTNLMDAVYVAVHGGTSLEVETALRNVKSFDGTKITNNLQSPVVFIGKSGAAFMLGRETFTGEQLVAGLRDTIMQASPTFHVAMQANASAMRLRGLAEATQATDKALNVLEAAFANGTVADLFHGIVDTTPRLTREGVQMGMTDLGTSLAKVQAEAMIPPVDKVLAKGAVAHEKLVESASKAATPKIMAAAKGTKGATPAAQVMEDIQRVGVDNALKTNTEVVQETLKELGGVSRDLGAVNQAAINASLMRKMFWKVNRADQMGFMHEKVVGSENLWRDMVGSVSGSLNDLSRALTRPQFVEAFRAVQKGFAPTDPAVAAQLGKVNDIMSQMFDVSHSMVKPSLLDSPFFRNNASITHINAAMAKYVPGDFSFDAALAAEKVTAESPFIMHHAAEQWKTWDVKDPAAFINGMYTSLAKINLDMSTAQTFWKVASDLNSTVPTLSKVPLPGFSRISNESGKSLFAKYLPDNVYVRDEVLDQLHMSDLLTQQSLDLSGDFGRFITTVYKPVQDLWKTGMTVMNPTHHIRNMVSDASLTYLAEGWTSKDIYRRALHVMGTRDSYDNWSAIKAIQGMGETPNAGKIIIAKSSLFPDGITADGLYSALAQRGNLPQFRTLESLDDLTGESVSGLQKMQTNLLHTKQMRVVGGITELRDHYARVAHAIQILESPKHMRQFKSAQEALDFASARVRKFHPDGSDLTSTEQAFKLIIPFYSWQRKTIPLIVESMLTHPARITAFPKASYALATSMGVNPDSLTDPFPQDQMFPSYLTDQIDGPQFQINGKYYGINPGFAGNDIINTYGNGNPEKAIMGSISPFIRSPFELAAGAQVGTGAKINDTSDYIDSQLPGIAPISRITGDSVTGSILSLLQGKGLDQQYQIKKGNKDQGTNSLISATNWLLGSGITPMSQPNQINYAEIEARNRAAAKANGN